MSLHAISAVRSLPSAGIVLDPRDRFILYALADYADDRLRAWPSYATLADWTGYARSTIVSSLLELERLGLIVSEQRRREDGSFSSKIYALSFAARTPPSGSRTPPSESRTPPVREPDGSVPAAGSPPVREPDPKIHQIDPPEEPPPTPPADDVDLELAERVTEAEDRNRISRAKTHDRAVLATSLPRVWRPLAKISSGKAWKTEQLHAVARRVLELVRTHSEDRVAEILEEIVLNLSEIRSPIAYLERALEKGAARAASPAAPLASVDATFDEIFGSRS